MIIKYLKTKEWVLIAFSVLLIAGQVYLDLKIPDYMSAITDLLNTGGSVNAVLDEGIWMLACAFGSLILAVITGFIAALIASSLSKRLRELQFANVQSFSMNEINNFSTASLITRSTNDVTRIQNVVSIGLQIIIKAPILAVWALAKIMGKGTEWSMLTAVAIIAILLVFAISLILVYPRFKKIQAETDDINRVTREGLTGIRVVRAYNAEEYQENKFEKTNKELTEDNLFVNRTLSFLMPALSFVMSMLSLGIYWIGAIMISQAPGFEVRLTDFSNMIVFSAYAMQVVMAFIMLVMVVMIVPRAMVSSKRIEEVIATVPSIKDGNITESPTGTEGTVSFRNVGFKYPNADEYVLKDVSFDAGRGETIAVIGSTGSGKSTLINLIPRFYDVTEGEVLVDGVNVKDYVQENLREKIGYVSQKAIMFTGTVSTNVEYGDKEESSFEDIKRAVAIAQGKDFVEKMDDAYVGAVAQGGSNLSGGQKQRLSIARAINKDPEIYIFDDSFSALDYKTDITLRKALKQETSGSTMIIVAQRIGTIIDADKIIVLENGTVAGMGRHEDLLHSCAVYREIAESQLSEKELNL